MNKNDVYRLIGYQGEYNANVKKAIRKLLKENHPDNKGDRKRFELINEVKKELESGKVSYTEKTVPKDNIDIDYDYCYKMINELKIKKNNLNEILNSKKELLTNYENEYKELYQKSLDLENKLLVNNELKNNKQLSIILLVLMIIIFIISVIKNDNILFIAFIVLSIVFVFIIQKRLFVVHKITEKNKDRFSRYVKINNSIRKNVKKQNNLKEGIIDIKRKLTNIENDLRFYNNLLK